MIDQKPNPEDDVVDETESDTSVAVEQYAISSPNFSPLTAPQPASMLGFGLFFGYISSHVNNKLFVEMRVD